MEKVSCFRISGVDLFLEQTLVQYNNVPIFLSAVATRKDIWFCAQMFRNAIILS